MEKQYQDNGSQPTQRMGAGWIMLDQETKPRGAVPSEARSGKTQGQPGPKRPLRSQWPILAVAGVVVLLIVFVAGFFGLNAALDGQYKGKIEPGVSISGVYVGEMSRDQAREAVTAKLENYIQKPVVLTFQDKTWRPNLEQLGVSINLDASLDQAEAYGKGGDFFKDLRVFKLMSTEAHNLPIEIQFNEAKLDGYLSDISDRIRKDTVEPEVKLDDAGNLLVTEGKDGFNVDYDATYAAIKNNLQSLTSSDENLLKVHNVPPVITSQEIQEFKNSLTPLLSGPVTLSFKDKSWTIDQKQIVAQIKINRNTDKTQPRHLSYTFNTPWFENYVTGLTKSINQDPQEGVVDWDSDAGKLFFAKPGQDGQYLSVGRTMDNLNQALVATDPEKRKTTLWVDIKEPTISASHPEKLGNLELIGEGVSSFAGSAYERATNIKVGAKWLNGAVVKPHSVFSFLDSVGEISQKRGYVTGYAIMADQTVPDVGGGICQVSTTTFRAAFFAGLPIVERNAHLYRVSWYEELGEPVGFDAAVYQPGVDFKFENPTDYYMVVKAFIQDGKLKVQILGNKTPGQTVDLIAGGISNVTNPPPDRKELDPSLAPGQKKQVDSARKGLTTSITRVIKLNGVEVKRDVFPTRFQAWPNIFKVGPDKTPVPTTAAPTTAAPTTAAPNGNATTAPAQGTAPANTTAPATPKPTTPPQATPKP
jgi:vancomycin resistance protein YoaR